MDLIIEPIWFLWNIIFTFYYTRVRPHCDYSILGWMHSYFFTCVFERYTWQHHVRRAKRLFVCTCTHCCLHVYSRGTHGSTTSHAPNDCFFVHVNHIHVHVYSNSPHGVVACLNVEARVTLGASAPDLTCQTTVCFETYHFRAKRKKKKTKKKGNKKVV